MVAARARVDAARPRCARVTLADEVRDAYARWWPAWASEQGLVAHDARLADPSPEGVARQAEEMRALLARVEAAAGPDRDVLAHGLREELFHLETLRLHERNPDLALELLDHLFGLLAKPAGRTREAVLAALAARLDGAGAYLAAGRRRVVPAEVPLLWCDVARESAASAPAFLDAVTEAAGSRPDARLAAALAHARDALAEHAAWLERDVAPVARGTFVLGRKTFDRLLEVRGIGRDSEELWALGAERVEVEQARLADTALAVVLRAGREPRPDVVAQALDLVRAERPRDFAHALATYATAIEEARAFVAAKGLATLADVPLRVVETPAYLRHLVPFAAYMDPGRWSASPEGVYLVTPKADMGAFPLADVRTTTVHEAWPGHHLQLSVARTIPLANFLQSATEYIEGWALYCEELMARHGFLATPEERFVLAKDALWRALRIRLDVGLATGRLTFVEAVAELRERVGFSTEEAEAEVKRYTLEPGYNLSYMVGKLAIIELRARHVEADGMDERAFHDAILAAGALPTPLLARAVAASLTGQPGRAPR